MRHSKRLTVLTVAGLLVVGFSLSRLAPRAETAAQSGQRKSPPAGRPAGSAKTAPAEPAAAASSPRNSVTQAAADSSPGGTLLLWDIAAASNDFKDAIFSHHLKSRLEVLLRNPRLNGFLSQPTPKYSPDGSKILFSESWDGFNNDIFVMDADGSNPVNLTNYPQPGQFSCRLSSTIELCRDQYGVWSPDGEHVAFIGGRTGRFELYVMKADGSNQMMLPSRMSSAPLKTGFGYYSAPSWSPDGTKIAYSYPADFLPGGVSPSANQSEIAVLSLDPDTLEVTADVQLTSNSFTELWPAWSPDGTRIAFQRESSPFPLEIDYAVWVMNPDGSNQTQLTETAGHSETNPVWSPDGSKIAFTRVPDNNGSHNPIQRTDIFVVGADGSNLTQVETGREIDYVHSWVDPCAAPPPGAAAKSAGSKSVASKPLRTHAAAASGFKCIQEIVVNVTTDDPDTDTADEFCDTDEDESGNQCSLRAAIQEANARPGIDLVTFDIPGDGLHTIAPASELPDITGQVAIDATTQPGYADDAPAVELSGAQAGAANGFNVRAGGVRIAGFVINRFSRNGAADKGNGIHALDTSGLRVQSCFIGTDAAGTAAAPNSNIGVYLRNTTDSTVGGYLASSGNLISGNGLGTAESPGFGVSILGTEGVPRGDNLVIGNRIGTDRTGVNALGNKSAGVIVALSTHNQIGGESDAPGVAPGNVITGDNPTGGVGVFLLTAKHTTIAGNLIGTDATGTKGFGNGIGILLTTGSTDNTIGGYSPQARNVVSGNKFGIDLFGAAVNDNSIFNNYVGTDVTGLAVVPIAGVPDYPQQRRGITVEGGSRNQIGDGSNTRNVVAGNVEVQISFLRPEATDNRMTANYVGLFADGNTAPTYDPREIGVWILGATKTVVGDSFSDARNVISGNGLGVFIANPTNHANAGNELVGNYVGTNAAGTAARPNASGGVIIARSSNNVVEGNVISGNGGFGGLALANDEAQQTSAAAPGAEPFAAAHPGGASKIPASSALSSAAALSRERWAAPTRSDKGRSAAQAETPETKNNVVIENYIGLNYDNAAIPNAGAGVFIGPGAHENLIGKPGDGNVISGNNGLGILLGNREQSTLSPTANKIQGNIIGLDDGATAKVPNTGSGVGVLFGEGTIIGGDTEDAGNVIAGNGGSGVAVVGTSNTVRFNFIGTNREGAQGLGNGGDGVKLENVAGLENTVADNAIGGNGGVGINVLGSAQAPAPQSASKQAGGRPRLVGNLTKIAGNTIGIVKVVTGGNTAGVRIANLLGGLKISDTFGVAVTKLAGGGPNIIAGNGGPGVLIEGANSTGNVVEGAIIGTDESGASGLGNAGDGVRIVNAPGNFVGGENKPGEARLGNTIAGNDGHGVAVEGAGAGGNAVQGNFVGVVSANGVIIRKGNGLLGIRIEGAAGTLVGLPGLGGLVKEQLGNVVAGNGLGGLLLQGASGTRVSGNAVGTDHAGATDLGNGGPGILMTAGTSGTVVGGPEEGSGNTITGNDGSGVRIDETGGTGNLIDPNSIYDNKAYGIDLGRRGVTPNDFGDADLGPNRLQNYPEITNVAVNGSGELLVSYRLTSAPAHSAYGTLGLYVEFFKSDGRGQGRKFLGSTHYTEADFNNGSPAVKQVNLGPLSALDIDADDPVTATASDAGGNTSEFSPPFSTRSLTVTETADAGDGTCDATCTLREALAAADAGNEIRFASPLFDTAQTLTLGGSELVVAKSVKIKGPGAHLLTVSANNLSRVFNVADGAASTLSGITITKGNALGAFTGGGVLNAGSLTLAECHVTDNVADRGAGLYNTGALVVRACTVSANKANLGSATPAAGGIQSAGGGSLELFNSTVSGNQATATDAAGGVYVIDGTARFTATTVTGNSAPQGVSSAGGVRNKDGAVTLANSVVAGNTAANPDLAGAFTSSGYNLVGVGDAGAAPGFPPGGPNANKDIVGTAGAPVDPRLDALGDYGGTTPTHRPQADSPALDRGRAFGETTDQRGLTRPSDDPNRTNAEGGDGSDIGAYETQVTPATVAAIGGRVTSGGAPLAGVTVTLTRPDSSTLTATTDAGGYYSFAGLPAGSYTVTPSRFNYGFTPASRTVVLSGVDQTADFESASNAVSPQPAQGSVLISEFRLSGVTDADEFVELYNNSDAPVSLAGYRLDTSTGFYVTLPAGASVPARGHYLIARLNAYTLADYAAPDLTFDFELPPAAGLALTDPSGAVLDAVGFDPAHAPYHEGAALASVSVSGQHSFVRRLATGRPQDSGVNAADFVLVGTDPGDGSPVTLGAPGPENSGSPVNRTNDLKPRLLDASVASSAAPNRVRDGAAYHDTATPSSPTGAGGAEQYTLGTLAIRRRFTNTTDEAVTRLRFRVVDVTTRNSPDVSGGEAQADLRALSTPGEVQITSGDSSVCDGQPPCSVTVRPTKVEQPPAQARGGGLNTTYAVEAADLPVPPGGTVDLQFLLGVARGGKFRFFVVVEALPGPAPQSPGATTGASRSKVVGTRSDDQRAKTAAPSGGRKN